MRRLFLGGFFGALAGGALAVALGAFSDPGDVLAAPPRRGFPPDPVPVPSTKQWVFEIAVKANVPTIVKVSEITLDKPSATARVMGRFALEFYIGTEILDRVRFDVPLTGDVPEDQPGKKRPQFRVNTKLFARMADQPRAALLRMVDRATGEVQSFRWPPDKNGKLAQVGAEPASSASADAGSDADASAPDAAKPDAGKTDAGPDGGPHKPTEP